MIWNIFKKGTDTSSEKLDPKVERYRDLGTRILQSETRPEHFTKLEYRIRAEFSLYHRWSSNKKVKHLLNAEIAAAQQLTGLPLIFMFHGDGRVREAALKHLEGPLVAPANVYSLFWRMNDWSPIVRDAAKHAARKCLPTTPATVIYPALKAMLPHVPNWGRWSNEGPAFVDATLMRQDVAELLLRDIIETSQPRLGQLFREIFRNPWIDQHLEHVARKAALPHIRAIALDALLTRKVRWPTWKCKTVWIDRSMGGYRKEPTFFDRDLKIDVDVPLCLRLGAQDRASIVRKRAADGIIAFRNDEVLRLHIDEISKILKNDKNIGVISRMDFLHRKRQE
ncbi:hypothetical protein FEE96_14400 [Parasedimentitalea maritima]|uniref:Uncharacterized protein n=1 Tax=Parasedimentitalea maritima TaxID=2578117 RepID=A0ABY2UTB1_9RHOB|nr:hypothetical protein [Zongyanglinia marina]TLP61430.1 hypothetical protein FEE96_14400 [Zongyanglinia marina]